MSSPMRPTPEQYEHIARVSAAVMAAWADLAAALYPIASEYAKQVTELYRHFQEAGLITEDGKPAQFLIGYADAEETP